jgi:hypothetical protein
VARPKREIDDELSHQLEATRQRARWATHALASGAIADILTALRETAGIDPDTAVVDDVTLGELIERFTAPSDPIEVVAWIGALAGEDHGDAIIAIDNAQRARYQWIEIADALGIDPHDDAAVSLLAKRHRRRYNERLSSQQP